MRLRTVKVSETEWATIKRAQEALRRYGYGTLKKAFPDLDVDDLGLGEWGWPTLGHVIGLGTQLLVSRLTGPPVPEQSPQS